MTDTEQTKSELRWEEALTLATAAVHGSDGRGMIGHGRRHLEERVARALVQQDRRATPSHTALEALREGIEILTNLTDSINRHGNYSAESTVMFIDQAAQCFRAALASQEPRQQEERT